jgi:hypothetical protein
MLFSKLFHSLGTPGGTPPGPGTAPGNKAPDDGKTSKGPDNGGSPPDNGATTSKKPLIRLQLALLLMMLDVKLHQECKYTIPIHTYIY